MAATPKTDRKFIKLVSSDNYEFYISESAAFVSKELQTKIQQAPKDRFEFKLNIQKEVLEIVIEYLHYKKQYGALENKSEAPEFIVPAQRAIEVLNASILFKI